MKRNLDLDVEEKHIIRRKSSQASLNEIIAFLGDARLKEFSRTVKEYYLDVSLRELAYALQELDDGRLPALFAKKANIKKGSSSIRNFIKASVAAAAELRLHLEMRNDDVFNLIAEKLRDADFPHTWGSGHIIKATTVEDWRNDVLEAERGNPLRDIYEEHLSKALADAPSPEIRQTISDYILEVVIREARELL